MNNIFLSRALCDSFDGGELVTTLPQPLDLSGMGVNLCELSLGGLVNVPAADIYLDGRVFPLTERRCVDIEELLAALCARRGFAFQRTSAGAYRAHFDPAHREMRIPAVLQEITGFPEIIRSGMETRDWDLFAHVPYVVAEMDAAGKTSFGNEMMKGLRLLPAGYKNEQEVVDYEFRNPNFVRIRDGEMRVIKFRLVSKNGVVKFLPGGTLQCTLQLAPVKSKLLL